MALNTQVSDTAANAAANALAALCNGGFMELYTATQPANANTAVSGQTLLVTLGLSATAFGGAVAGVLTANTISPGNNAATGTATWFRVYKSDGTTAVFDGSVGTTGCNLNMNSNVLQSGAQTTVTAFTHSLLESASGY